MVSEERAAALRELLQKDWIWRYYTTPALRSYRSFLVHVKSWSHYIPLLAIKPKEKWGLCLIAKSKILKGEFCATLSPSGKSSLSSRVPEGDSSPSQVHASQPGTETNSRRTGTIGAFPVSAEEPLKMNRTNLSSITRCALLNNNNKKSSVAKGFVCVCLFCLSVFMLDHTLNSPGAKKQSNCTQARITACLCQFPEVTVRKADRKEAPSCRGNEVRNHPVDHPPCEGKRRDSGAREPGRLCKKEGRWVRGGLWGEGFVSARPGEG